MGDSAMTRIGQIDRRPGAQFGNPADLDQIWRLLGRITSTDTSLLEITYGSRGITFTPKTPRAKRAQTIEEPVAALSTPFLGSIHEDLDKITIGADRDLGTGGGPAAFGDEYTFFDTITIGLDELTKFEPEDTTVIAATSFVYYRITKAGAVITALLEHSVARPVQIHGTLFVILGRAIHDGSEIVDWAQYWFGDVPVWGRFA